MNRTKHHCFQLTWLNILKKKSEVMDRSYRFCSVFKVLFLNKVEDSRRPKDIYFSFYLSQESLLLSFLINKYPRLAIL